MQQQQKYQQQVQQQQHLEKTRGEFFILLTRGGFCFSRAHFPKDHFWVPEVWQSESESESAAILKGIAEDMASPRQFQNSEKCTRPSVNLRCVASDIMSAVISNKGDFLMDVSHRVDSSVNYPSSTNDDNLKYQKFDKLSRRHAKPWKSCIHLREIIERKRKTAWTMKKKMVSKPWKHT